MAKRTSHVQSLTNISVDTSSVIQIGDSKELDAVSYVLAVQREKAIFYENEFLFRDYFAFCEPIDVPVITEPLEITTCQETSAICVNKARVNFLAASSVLHVGSNESICLGSRVKNIRHIMKDADKNHK